MSARAIRDDPVIEATVKVATEDEPTGSAGDVAEHEAPLTPTVQPVLEPVAHNYYQHWGLNE